MVNFLIVLNGLDFHTIEIIGYMVWNIGYMVFFAHDYFVIFMKSCNWHPYFNNITFKWEFKSDLNLSYKVKLDIWSILGWYQFSKSPHPIFTPFHSTTDIWSYCLYGQFVRAKTADHISGMECTTGCPKVTVLTWTANFSAIIQCKRESF